MSNNEKSRRLLGAGVGCFLLGLAIWLLLSGLNAQKEEGGRSEGATVEFEGVASNAEKSKLKSVEEGKKELLQNVAKSESFERKVADEDSSAFPTATRSMKPNAVISPYPPHHILDTTGAESGDELIDPSTIPIDPETGKPMKNLDGSLDLSKAKRFRVP